MMPLRRAATDDRPRHPIVGPSMFPLVRPLHAVLESTRDLRPGDIAAFLGPMGDRLIFHRVVSVEGETLHTRGDLNLRPDDPVPLHAVLGRVVRIEWGGYGVDVPPSGLRGALWRRVGLSWGHVAPHLGLALGRLRTKV